MGNTDDHLLDITASCNSSRLNFRRRCLASTRQRCCLVCRARVQVGVHAFFILLLSPLHLFYSMCVCVFVYKCVDVHPHTGRSGDNLWKPVLSFHHVGPRDGSLVVRLGSRRLCSEPSHQAQAFPLCNTLPWVTVSTSAGFT